MKKDTAGPTKANKPPKRTPAFKKAGNGIEAHGHVSELREHHDGSGVRLGIKHGKRKTGHDGIFDGYPDESSFTIPLEAAKDFVMGGRVKIRVAPHVEGKKTKTSK